MSFKRKAKTSKEGVAGHIKPPQVKEMVVAGKLLKKFPAQGHLVVNRVPRP